MNSISFDVLVAIFYYLDPLDIINFSKVCILPCHVNSKYDGSDIFVSRHAPPYRKQGPLAVFG